MPNLTWILLRKEMQLVLLGSSILFATACAPQKFEYVGPTDEPRKTGPVDATPTPSARPTATPTPFPTPPMATTTPTPTPVPPGSTPTPPPPTPAPTATPGPTATPVPTPPSPTPQGKVTKVFDQSEGANKLDILVISDNSYSMEVDQKKLGKKFSNFISAIQDIDWQIGITTTDTSDGIYGIKGSLLNLTGTQNYILTPQTLEPEKRFLETVVRRETMTCETAADCPTGDEKPLVAAMMAMSKRSSYNAGFFRNNVNLVVLVISDEDESAVGGKASPTEVVDHFRSIWGTTKKLVTHGIVIEPWNEKCLKKQQTDSELGIGGSYAFSVSDLARLTGGTLIDICKGDYGQDLSKLSRNMRVLVNSFDLGEAPTPGSVQVTMTPSSSISYVVEGTKIVFATAPPAGTHIEITYTPKQTR